MDNCFQKRQLLWQIIIGSLFILVNSTPTTLNITKPNSPFLRDDDSTKDAICSRINCYRGCHSVSPLTRDTQIETSQSNGYAQKLGSTGTFTHSDSAYGENLYGGPQSTDCVDEWYFECGSDYIYGSESNGLRCGHFTQMVWKSSQRIGIGIAPHSNYGYVVVANFDPPGNYGGRYAENVLKPDSSCVNSCKSQSISGGGGSSFGSDSGNNQVSGGNGGSNGMGGNGMGGNGSLGGTDQVTGQGNGGNFGTGQGNGGNFGTGQGNGGDFGTGQGNGGNFGTGQGNGGDFGTGQGNGGNFGTGQGNGGDFGTGQGNGGNFGTGQGNGGDFGTGQGNGGNFGTGQGNGGDFGTGQGNGGDFGTGQGNGGNFGTGQGNGGNFGTGQGNGGDFGTGQGNGGNFGTGQGNGGNFGTGQGNGGDFGTGQGNGGNFGTGQGNGGNFGGMGGGFRNPKHKGVSISNENKVNDEMFGGEFNSQESDNESGNLFEVKEP